MHFWSKFGDSSWNGWQVIMQRSSNYDKFILLDKFYLEGQVRSTPETIWILTILRCVSDQNFVILAWMGDKLLCGQTQNELKFDYQVKFGPEGQGRSPLQNNRDLIKVFCTCTPNLVMLAWTSVELWCGQARDWCTHTHGHTATQTHRHRQRQYLEAKTGLG